MSEKGKVKGIEFHMPWSHVEKVLAENKGRTPPPFYIVPAPGTGGNPGVIWKPAMKMRPATREKIQASLDDLSTEKGLPKLTLTLTHHGYIARIDEKGYRHPDVDIVTKKHTGACVLYKGKVYNR